MITKENILKYKPEQISFDKENLFVNGEKYPCKNPRLEFARALSHFATEIQMYSYGKSWIAGNTIFGKEQCFAAIYRSVKIGFSCVIGDAGFGYEYDEQGQLFQMPHLGRVRIGEGVVIRNSVMIDRAVLGETVIGEGTVIDNLVHVAHGAKIGKNCLIVAGAVIGGSAEIGDRSFIGMNASIKNKVKIGCGCIIGAGAVVTKDVADGLTIIGANKILEK